ncbi:MAG: hypothetical protein ACM31C_34275 [Acidobacteriota bacterium]
MTQTLSNATFFRLSLRRLAGRIGPVHILALVALLEVVIDRVAVPMLRPATGDVPRWHEMLDYFGLFLFYFTGTLAVLIIGWRCFAALRDRRGAREVVAHVLLAIAAILAAIPLVVPTPDWLTFPLELAFAASVIGLVVASFARDRDLGVQMGAIVLAMPLLVHTVSVIGVKFDLIEGGLDLPNPGIARAGVLALCAAALVSPYVFAPRPFARAVTRPMPVLVAMGIAALGAVAARMWYAKIASAAALAIGVELEHQADPRLALYLLGFATLAWTLASCAIAASAARRTIGLGIALIVLGGYGFRWPNHYLLPLLGLALIADAARRVREEELSALPLASDTPPVADPAWSAYVGAVVTGLKRSLDEVHSLTSRGEGGLASSLIVGEKAGMTVRTRIERIDGSVIALDVVVGREIDELRGATLTLWAMPPRALGINPPAPPAAPQFKSGDAAFDDRFRTRGSALALQKLLDDGLRARAVATLDGWLAYWDAEGLRYRVYPGRGAPLDHPIPLSDLALGRPATAERLVAVIELLVEIAARGVEVKAAEEPAQLDHEAPEAHEA